MKKTILAVAALRSSLGFTVCIANPKSTEISGRLPVDGTARGRLGICCLMHVTNMRKRPGEGRRSSGGGVLRPGTQHAAEEEHGL